MEAAGIEPASAAAPDRASTGLAHPLISPGRPVCERPTAGPAILESHPSGDWLSFGASPFYDAAPRTTGRVRSDASPNYLGGECEIRIRTYVGFPGFLTRPTGVLDLQLSRRTDHVETWSPPYVREPIVAAPGQREAPGSARPRQTDPAPRTNFRQMTRRREEGS